MTVIDMQSDEVSAVDNALDSVEVRQSHEKVEGVVPDDSIEATQE